MTENPRTSLLRLARRRTAAIVIGTLAGTGLLTVGIAATAQQASSQDGGTPSDTTSGGTSGTGSDNSFGAYQSGGGVSSSTGSGGSDGGTHSS